MYASIAKPALRPPCFQASLGQLFKSVITDSKREPAPNSTTCDVKFSIRIEPSAPAEENLSS